MRIHAGKTLDGLDKRIEALPEKKKKLLKKKYEKANGTTRQKRSRKKFTQFCIDCLDKEERNETENER